MLTQSFFQWSRIAKNKFYFFLQFTLGIRTGIYFCYLNSTVPQNLNTNCKRVSQVKTRCANYSTLVDNLLEKKKKLTVKPILYTENWKQICWFLKFLLFLLKSAWLFQSTNLRVLPCVPSLQLVEAFLKMFGHFMMHKWTTKKVCIKMER